MKIKGGLIYGIIFLLAAAALVFSLVKADRTVVIVRNNNKREPLPVENNRYMDAHCGMILTTEKFAAEVISKNGDTWFFHDPGGVPLWIRDRGDEFKKESDIWFLTIDTGRWKKSSEVWFSLTDRTPMEYGFGAYERKNPGYISYREMELRMLRGENMTNPKVRKTLLEKKHGDR